MKRKLNIYFFGETGVYDENNPAYVCSKELVPEILYLIAYNEPFSISKKDIIKELKINNEMFNNIIDSLKLINAIDIKDEKYKLNFPAFLQEDIPILDEYFLNIGKVIGEKVIEKKQLIYEKISRLTNYSRFKKERLLYHIICDNIFDGTAFDFFTEKNIFPHFIVQPMSRNYIIIGYEDSENVENHSNRILCSSNNYRTERFEFNSFGDSDGKRKDMYRFFNEVKKILVNATPFNDLNLSYIRIIEDKNIEIAEKCGELIWKSFKGEIALFQLSDNEKNLVNFLNKLGYLNIDEENNKVSCNVPIFENADKKIIDEVSEIILNDIYEIVKVTFENFEREAKTLTPIKHKINIKEIAIELWHQVFGFTNEYLVQTGFVETPEYKNKEGRYLRSFSIKQY